MRTCGRSILSMPNLCLFHLVQSQGSSAAVPPRPAQRHHIRPGLEGRHHYQTLAGPTGEEPAGGSGHWSPGHPSPPTVTLPAPHQPWGTTAINCPTDNEPSMSHGHGWHCFYERLKGCLIIFLLRCVSNLFELHVHGPRFKDINICCLTMCSPTDLQTINCCTACNSFGIFILLQIY